MSLRNKSFKYLLVIIPLFVFGGCSIWENFTTYFNLYYNTSTLFEDAEKEILSQKRDLFSTEPLVIPATARTSLTKVIEKSSKLLQFYSGSSYVNDALLMLGKSFYYQGNYLKSKKKFEEFLAAETDDEEEITEANLWLAKCAFELRDFNNALKLLEEVRTKAVEEGYDEIIKESYVQEIKYRIKENDLSKAIILANEFAEVYDDDVVRAKIYYELGNMYSKLDDDKNALIAYEKVFENEPDFDLEITATIKYANALRENKQPDKALEIFKDIREKDKFRESYGEIDFQIGKTFVELGDYDRAYDQFKIVDTTYRNTAFASASNFEMAELYRTRFMNYDSAGYYYSKASTSTLPEDYKEKAKNNNQLFTKYANLRKDINRLNRQLYYSQNPEVFKKDSSNYVADSLKLLTEFLERKEMQEIWGGVDTLLYPKDPKLKDSTFIKDSIFVRDSLVKIDSLIQIGLFSPQDSIGLRQKLIDSLKTRRLNDLKDPRNPDNILKNSKVSLDSVKFKRNPPQKLKISIDSAQTVLAKNSLELGNLFLAELNVQDSALVLYENILEEYPSPVYYPNTLYALGSYYLTVNNKAKADSLFEIIYDKYKDRTIVNAAANKLNKPLINLGFDPAKDEYASAEDLMLEGNYDQSIIKFYSIYNNFPKSPVAPQALYTTGWILENDLFLLDSAAVVYDTLLAKYPSSQYVKQVSKKVTAYKQEKTKLAQMLKDSLAALNKKQVTDSTLIAGNTIQQEDEQGAEENSIVDDEIKINQKNGGKEPIEFVNQEDKLKPPIKKKLEPLWDPRKHFN